MKKRAEREALAQAKYEERHDAGQGSQNASRALRRVSQRGIVAARRKPRTPKMEFTEADIAHGADTLSKDDALSLIENWFFSRGWEPFAFQTEAWQARLRGKSGLIQVATGSGKTYAAFMGALAQLLTLPRQRGVRILYITPLKAVSRDIRKAIEEALQDLAPHMRVEDRTGDTAAHVKARQKLGAPEILVTTPESLSLLISHGDHAKFFEGLETVILDEWHECLGNKRGSLLELSLSRLKHINHRLAIWAMTATIDNPEEAAEVAAGPGTRVITAEKENRPIEIESLLPEKIDSFPWAGHLGTRMMRSLIERLDPRVSTLIFTNTRSQAERWFHGISERKPDWRDKMALHHGSLDAEERDRVEAGVKSGTLSLVVCTSSLDLGVDFGPVEMVVQIGSPKGLGRLVQRAGRAAHRPLATARVVFVPTHALELLEIQAAREALKQGQIEPRLPIKKPLDVLAQHLVTRALGGGFTRDEIAHEIRSAYSYRDVTDEELDWALKFVSEGGVALQAYPAFRKVVNEDGVYRVRDGRIARVHRMSIGTIEGQSKIRLKFQRGKEIGHMEEHFVARLKKGDRFLFGGRILEFRRLDNMDAIVKLAKSGATVNPGWGGTRLPYSASLAAAVRDQLDKMSDEDLESNAEARAIQPIVRSQRRLSAVPKKDEILIERLKTREGHHLFIFPFEGRLVHEALASIVAYRLAKRSPSTFSISSNDFGIELLSPEPIPRFDASEIFSPERLDQDLLEALNLAQLARQEFRGIARVAGLLHPGHPGARKNAKQLQVSAGLLFDVFQRYEPNHPLIRQAESQALGNSLEHDRLLAVCDRLSRAQLIEVNVNRPTPFAFPLIVERIGARLSTESLEDRIERMKNQWVEA